MTITDQGGVALGIILEGIFYGAYMVLFVLSLVLRHRNRRTVDGPLTLAQMLLFGLCTISLCLDIPSGYFSIVPDMANAGTIHKISLGSAVVFTIIDYLAQMILLYRCWIIWDRRWVVVAVPGLLALVTLAGGFAIVGIDLSPLQSTNPEKFNWLYTSMGTMAYSVSLCVNALTTSLLVTKILLISREVCPGLGSDSHRSLRIVTAMLIESGLLMFAFQLVFVVLWSTNSPAPSIISFPITQIYGITPTLLGIRAIMGSAYDKTTEKTRSLRFAHSRGAATQTTGLSMSAAGVQSRVIDIDLDEVPDETADTTV